MSSAEDTILAIAEAYKAAVFAKDPAALMRLYAGDARVFDAFQVWSYEGRGPWSHTVEEWLSSIGSGERVKVTFDDVRIEAGDTLASLSATVTYAAASDDGTQLRSLQNRLTWALRSAGSGWAIVHEHTSAPVSHGEGKAILRRADAVAPARPG